MTARPTLERLAEIRAIAVGMGSWGIPGAMETYPWPSHVGESEGLDAIRDLLAEVDALRETIYAMDRELESGHAAMLDLNEARAILADLYAIAQDWDRYDTDASVLVALQRAVLERCRPKGES